MKLAVIPARGGSQRIPRKNIRIFAGRPIIAWSIAAALASGLFDRVVVSTDDAEIAAVARDWGAETPFLRPADLADAYTGTNAVAKHALAWFLEQGQPFDIACCLYATAPFVTAAVLRRGLELLETSGKRYAFAVTSFDFPIQRGIRLLAQGGVEPLFPEAIMRRSQDLEPAYHDAGQFYWGESAAFLDDLPLFGPDSAALPLPRWLVQDIDTEEDWRRAELMFEAARRLADEGGA